MKSLRHLPTVKGLAFALFWLLFISPVSSAGDAIYTGFLGNTALSGYDAVSYFRQGKAVKGSKKYMWEYMGAEWLFSHAGNLQAFKKSPESYAPQYGGFCAWAVATKKARASGDPQQWTIVDGKLYLNYSESVQQDWLTDVPDHIVQANKHWPEMLSNE